MHGEEMIEQILLDVLPVNVMILDGTTLLGEVRMFVVKHLMCMGSCVRVMLVSMMLLTHVKILEQDCVQ
jgi:hypothetical protein